MKKIIIFLAATLAIFAFTKRAEVADWLNYQLNPVEVFYDSQDGLGVEIGNYTKDLDRQLYEFKDGKIFVKGTRYSPKELRELVEAGQVRVTWTPLPYEGRISLAGE